MQPLLTLYVVQNAKGQYFRAKGHGGYGPSWVDELTNAKLYAKIGFARSTMTFYTKNFAKHGKCTLMELHVTNAQVVEGEHERAELAIKKIAERKLADDLRNKQYYLEQAEKRVEEAKSELKKLRSKK